MSFTNDCGKKLTGEHLISDGIMKLLGIARPTNIRNPDGKIISKALPAVQAKVLCDRHNSLFGNYFDPVGLSVAREIFNFCDNNKYRKEILVNGRDFERCILQRLCANYYGKLCMFDGKKVDFPILENEVQQGFLNSDFGIGGGLYIVPPPRYEMSAASYDFQPLIEKTIGSGDMFVGGARISICGITFSLLLRPMEFLEDGYISRRPSALCLHDDGGCRVTIRFAWPLDSDNHEVVDIHKALSPFPRAARAIHPVNGIHIG